VIRYGKSLVRLLFVLSLVLLGGSLASADSVGPERKAPPAPGDRARLLTTALKRHGFEVSQGYFELYTIDDCQYSYAVMGSCYFNNAAAPYVVPVVSFWPDEYVDPATQGAWGPTKDGYSTSHRLDPNEAIVIFGILPPKAAYFGIQTYLYTRQGAYQTDNPTYELISTIGAVDTFFHTVPGNPARIQTFDSLSNSINNVVIQRQSGATWNQLRYFIITPDRYMDKAVRQILHKLWVADRDIFTEPIPSNMKLGLDASADDFLSLFRYSMPKDASAADKWRNDPPLFVMRIRDARPHRPPQPYPPVVLATRTAKDERWLKPDLDDLVDRVRERWEQPCTSADCSEAATTFILAQLPDFNVVGPLCEKIGMDCLGDTQDASYSFLGGWTFDHNEVYGVAGALGTETGNATYVGVGVNDTQRKLGAANLSDGELLNTAGDYPGVNHAEKLFVYYFTRDCAGLEALTGGHCLSVTEDMIPAGVIASFTERDYIRPGTQRGPDSALTLPSRVIKLYRP
jgi:hypothetical protein